MVIGTYCTGSYKSNSKYDHDHGGPLNLWQTTLKKPLTMVSSSLPPVVCRRAHVLFTLYVVFFLLPNSGVQHILCCVFVLFVFVLCIQCCQFLWIVHFWLPLQVFFNVYLRHHKDKNHFVLSFDIYVISDVVFKSVNFILSYTIYEDCW